jgi:uncharacterized protein
MRFSSLKRLFLIGIVAYLAIMAFMATYQRSFLYVPAPAWQAPADHGLPQAARREIVAGDGTRLLGWWIPPKRADAPVYLYFHGNADGLSKRATRFGYLAQNGAGVLAMSYRGYGGSGGKPSEADILADAAIIHATLVSEFPATRIIAFGESLGTGVALNLASTRPVAGMILDSPYLSVLHRAQATYPWLPVSWLLADTFRSDLWIRNVAAPILIIHGTADDLIPNADSEQLAALAKSGQVTRKLYPGQPHVVPLNKGPMPDIEEFVKKTGLQP